MLVRTENLLKNYQVRQSLIKSDTKPVKPFISEADIHYLAELENLVKTNVGNFGINTDFLAAKLSVSRSVFFRKVKKLTGLTPNEYINEVRYNLARELLETRAVTSVKVVAGKVGMKDVNYFSQQFKDRFGKSPSAYF